MTTSIRNRWWVAAGLGLVVGVCGASRIEAQSESATLLRVRVADTKLQRAVASGRRRSAMFRNLVDTVERSRAYVYVVEGPYLPGKIEGCVVLDVGGIGIDRYLRMYIKPSLPIDRMIAVIGHELQHVLEILDADAQKVPRRTLKPAGAAEIAAGRYETQAATDAGRRIATELRLHSKIPQGAPENE